MFVSSKSSVIIKEGKSITHHSHGYVLLMFFQRDHLQAHSSPRPAAPQRGEGVGEVRDSAGTKGGRGEGAGAEDRLADRPPHSAHYRNGTSVRHPSQTHGPESSCLLTPPNTPLYPEISHAHAGSQSAPPLYPENTHQRSHTQANGCVRSTPEHKINGFISNDIEG